MVFPIPPFPIPRSPFPKLSQIAEEIGSSRATVARLFEHELGHGAGEEIMRQRIDMAKRLLKNDSLSVSEVAYRTGFCNPAYFTNTFRRETGITPKDRRNSALTTAVIR